MITKMRVRELSSELGITNKELLHLLRQENIQVKSHMSGLTEEQVELVRQKISKKKDKYTQDTVTPSGVIVRRKRQPSRTQKLEEKIPEKEVEEKEVSPKPEPKKQTLDQEEPQIKETTTDQAKDQAKEEITTQRTEEESQPPAQKRAKVTERRDKGKKRPPRPKRDKKSSKEASSTATIISKPEPQKEAPPSPDKEKKLEKEESKEEPKKEEPVAKEKPPKTLKPQKKKGKADKRVVDVSSLYDKNDWYKKKSDWKRKKPTEVKEKTTKTVSQKKPSKEEVSKPAPAQPVTQPMKAAKRKIKMEEAIRVSDLAQEMRVKAQDIIKNLLDLGVMATINQSLDVDTATLVASEFGFEVEKVGFSEEEFILPQKEDKPEEMEMRPPVVTIMGHVDHGKTSLLDAIRKSHIMDKEAGGITQHIGAYYVNMDNGSIVFLDTPGHEAFTEMRSRGAQVTDIVILIVAADDGVMDQTKEAINHAKAAEVPIIVAINKIDKDNADPGRVKRELTEYGLIPEEWGGQTIFAEISAKNRVGLESLLEMVLLQSEVMELKANPHKRARGHIVEARLDKGRGPVGTVLVQEGRLHTGEPFVCGLYHGKVRALFNDRGQKIETADPAMPVEVQGFEGVPKAGEEFVVVENDKVAKQISEMRQTKHREKELAKETKVTLESFFAAKSEEDIKVLNLILKADVQGSLEAINESIQKLSTEEVKVKVIHGGIGAISESDIKLAAASSAVIIGFNVRPSVKVKEIAEQEGVDIRFYNVIYQLVNEVKEAMAGMLEPITREVYLGQAEVRNSFNVPKVGTVAGCYILDGKLKRNAGVRLLRNGVVMYTGKIDSLKRFKDDVKEVYKEYECGVGLENFNDIKIGDTLEAFEEVKEKAKLE